MRIESGHPELALSRQCELLGLSRSSWYYSSQGEDEVGQALMRLIDRQYTAAPFYGVRRMTAWLRRQGEKVNPKRVRRLMRLMGLEAIYARPRTSVKSLKNKVYPYLLKGLVIDRPNQVWCVDITYIAMHRGWLYLVAVMDWFSRCVLAWELSVTLDVGFCLEAMRKALSLGTPEIFNSDQGSQFTSGEFTGLVAGAGIAISMDGRGRAYDNIFIERLWRSVKYEEVYLHDYQAPDEARAGLARYFRFYNGDRVHQGLGYRTPGEVYGLPPSPIRAQAGMIELPAVAPVALRAPCATAGPTMGTTPP